MEENTNKLLEKIKNKYNNKIIVTNCILNAFGGYGKIFSINNNSILKIKYICMDNNYGWMINFYFEYKNRSVYFTFGKNNINFNEDGCCSYFKIIEN